MSDNFNSLKSYFYGERPIIGNNDAFNRKRYELNDHDNSRVWWYLNRNKKYDMENLPLIEKQRSDPFNDRDLRLREIIERMTGNPGKRYLSPFVNYFENYFNIIRYNIVHY